MFFVLLDVIFIASRLGRETQIGSIFCSNETHSICMERKALTTSYLFMVWPFNRWFVIVGPIERL